MAAPDAGERIQKAEATLSAALRARGHEVEAGTAVVSGERINFRFEEVLREMQAPFTAQERRSVGKGAPATKRVLMPTSKPVLIAKPADRHGGGERRWTDKRRRLEDQMDRIVLRFEAIAQKAMDGRARAEEFDREFKASMRRAALRLQRERAEAARPRALRALGARWAETRRLRAFLDAAETHIASESAPGALAAWLDWARAYVEDFDPLSSASLEELRAETEHLLSLPKDDGDWDEDEQEWRDMGWLDDLSWLDERD